MNYVSNFISAMFIAVLCFAANSANAFNNHTNRKQNSFSSKYNFSLQPSKNSFRKSENILVKITLKNIGAELIKIRYELSGDEYSSNDIKIKNNKRQVMPLPSEGEKAVKTPRIGIYTIFVERYIWIRNEKMTTWKQLKISSNSIKIKITE